MLEKQYLMDSLSPLGETVNIYPLLNMRFFMLLASSMSIPDMTEIPM